MDIINSVQIKYRKCDELRKFFSPISKFMKNHTRICRPMCNVLNAEEYFLLFLRTTSLFQLVSRYRFHSKCRSLMIKFHSDVSAVWHRWSSQCVTWARNESNFVQNSNHQDSSELKSRPSHAEFIWNRWHLGSFHRIMHLRGERIHKFSHHFRHTQLSENLIKIDVLPVLRRFDLILFPQLRSLRHRSAQFHN